MSGIGLLYLILSFAEKFLKKVNVTLTLQKSRMLQIQGIEGAVIVTYCKSSTTQKMRYPRLSWLATPKL